MDGKSLIFWVILGSVGLLILGSLGFGSGSYLYDLSNQNADKCTNGAPLTASTCAGENLTANAPVELIAGTIIPIIFIVAVALRFI